MDQKKAKKTSWGAVANWYDETLEKGSDTFQEKVILPNLMRLVDPRNGTAVFDLACGQGYFSRAFAEKGADVTGCDISKELIGLAMKQSTKNIKYFVSSADDWGIISKNIADKKFDAVTVILALQNIERLYETMDNCAKILKEKGKLIIVLNHPAFRIPKHSGWKWSEEGDSSDKANAFANKLFRQIDMYMSEESSKIDMTPGASTNSDKKFTVSFHRPMQSYFKSLFKAGFAVTRLEEWISHKKSEAGPRSREEDKMRKEIPMFLMIEATKTS